MKEGPVSQWNGRGHLPSSRDRSGYRSTTTAELGGRASGPARLPQGHAADAAYRVTRLPVARPGLAARLGKGVPTWHARCLHMLQEGWPWRPTYDSLLQLSSPR